MDRKIFRVIFILLLCQCIGCVAIYRSMRDKRDRNYQEGVAFYKQHKIAEAHECFDTVVDIEPEYRDAKRYLRKTTRLLALKERRVKQRANINYERGVAMLNRRRYDDALRLLLLAQQQDPDHEEVEDKIDECREKLAPRFDQLIKIAERQYDRKQYIPAYRTYLKARDYDPSSMQVGSLRRRIEGKLEDNAEKYYDRGRELYNRRQYAAAQRQFRMALRAHPWYEDAREFLNKTSGRLNLDKNYTAAVTMFNRGNYFGAKTAFNQVNSIEPSYKATEQYLSRISGALAGQAPAFYNSGVALYDKGNYQAAIGEFNKVLAINPGHTQAQEYRQRAQTKLDIQKSLGGSQ
ncbi:MAG: tetratricopeptide repeat protein [Spirochaetes bacterium]|nr:tetratricopeptide repeat protein [Spirochaetota bacterium]